jgi:hypothetical protein
MNRVALSSEHLKEKPLRFLFCSPRLATRIRLPPEERLLILHKYPFWHRFRRQEGGEPHFVDLSARDERRRVFRPELGNAI